MIATVNLKSSSKITAKRSELFLDKFPGATVAYSIRRLQSSVDLAMVCGRRTDAGFTNDILFTKNEISNNDLAGIANISGHDVTVLNWVNQVNGTLSTTTPNGSRSYIFDYLFGEYLLYNDSKIKVIGFDANPNVVKYIRGEKCFSPSTNWTVMLIYKITNTSTNNVVLSDGTGFNGNGVYVQNGFMAFARTGATGAATAGIPVNNTASIYVWQHFSNNTVRACSLYEQNRINDLITIAGGWTVGNRTETTIGQYQTSLTLSLNGAVCEFIFWPNVDHNPIELITEANKYYQL
jgi:hypothetical protein